MKEEYYFKHHGNPEITVALPGISKTDWSCVTRMEGINDAQNKMQTHKFDIMPIKESDGSYKRFYKTIEWGKYEKIEENEIKTEDSIYYLTNIEDVIKAFFNTNKKFFFLDNETDIVGLISIGNLNSKHVYLYLYNLVAQFEISLVNLIEKSGIDDLNLIAMFEKRTESKNSLDALKRYKEEDEKGLDYKFIEYIYLTDLAYIIKKKNLIQNLGMNKNEFDKGISAINETIRKAIAHPNKSLIRNDKSIADLNNALNRLNVILESVNNYLSKL